MKNRKKSITLVLGGARSGKSRYAQELASGFERVTFIATAWAADTEMRKKISQHRRDRPSNWKTVEAQRNLRRVIDSESRFADVLLLDCLTFHAFKLLKARKQNNAALSRHIRELGDAIHASKSSVIVVSNEVGSGIVPEYRSGRLYRELLGQMNQAIAQIADNVVLMVAGVPVSIKKAQVGGR
ncbi:MAG TPA: bifunctional adenosylcobinamide kinase/adenosylcobinamide-phosphate guanylyltransferase [Candidatus Acidoferrales bacterium]|nr:bifunctional adenosylcobinamide kinase/adenosylcobinamide-phosphate guanylyltransferase [Candidatus Acidoferrales bacterium]